MALTQAQRAANYRARKKGEKEPYNSAEISAVEEALAAKESELQQLLDEVAEHDAAGKRYRSEARSYTKLVRLYYGQPEVGDVDEDEKVGGSALKKKKTVQPNPSTTKLR